ncbi:hypothetical protein [Paraflavitalea speifideaquila]|uniref:hypothetical protein n=1 Tax=Paraflavitalea speifideaquila TaxID=3076558 RepID=UPI0028E4F187|nr:hypothetical protein [Paraflavitalea speifideiaquila]
MIYKNKISRAAIPGYSLIPQGDHHQVRMITLTADRVKKDPAFHRTRICAGDFKKQLTWANASARHCSCMLSTKPV